MGGEVVEVVGDAGKIVTEIVTENPVAAIAIGGLAVAGTLGWCLYKMGMAAMDLAKKSGEAKA